MPFSLKCTNKNEGLSLRRIDFRKRIFSFRQKDMQRQLEKITNLVRLVVQKMEIRTEIESDDIYQGGKNGNNKKIQKVRYALNAARRFSRAQNSPFEHSDKL